MVKHTHARDPAVGPAAKPRVALNAVDGRGINMGIGAFSVSLAVKDIRASRALYQKLGFVDFGGNIDDNWLIMKNDDCIIGLFQGMFDKNILTFNPGWSQDTKTLKSFDDVRKLQKQFEEKGITLTTRADEKGKGPASFTCNDPDGNQILVDQHVD